MINMIGIKQLLTSQTSESSRKEPPANRTKRWVGFDGSALCRIAGLFVAMALAAGAAELKPFTVGSDVFDPAGGHIQGIAASEEAIYVAQMTLLLKFDWTGKLIRKVPVIKHTGDIAYHNGEIFAAVAVYEGPNTGKGMIRVFDRDLNLLRETLIDRTVDGIAYLDGVLFVGMGAKTQPSEKEHRVNVLGRFDAKTLAETAPRADFDYGYETKFGFQNIATDGHVLYGTFYSVKGAPQIAMFDKSLKILGTHTLDANQGLDVVPPALTGGKLLFVKAKTKTTKKPKSVSCSFDFWAPSETKAK